MISLKKRKVEFLKCTQVNKMLYPNNLQLRQDKLLKVGGGSGNQYRKPPYCKVGQSEGKIVTAQTGSSGPDTSLGETGLALSVNGKEICLISTKHTKGGYVAKASQTTTPQPAGQRQIPKYEIGMGADSR